jgi:hypothetical protein
MSDTNEQRLWLAVVTQATADATHPRDSDDRAEARAWLTTNTKDFRRICDWAGLNADDVRENAERLAANGWQAPVRRRVERGATC